MLAFHGASTTAWQAFERSRNAARTEEVALMVGALQAWRRRRRKLPNAGRLEGHHDEHTRLDSHPEQSLASMAWTS